MDRFVNQDGANFQAGVVNVDLVFVAGAAGAVPSTFIKADGIASVTKSTNDYIVQLQDYYIAQLASPVEVQQAVYNASTGACEGHVTASSVDTNGRLTMSFYNAAGTAVSLATGDILRATFRLQRWNTY